MERPRSLDQALNLVVTLAVVVLVAVVVRREFLSGSSGQRGGSQEGLLTHVSQWDEVLAAGLLASSPAGPVQVVVFEDLECPYCKRFHETVLSPLRDRFGDSVTSVLVHFPLAIHRFAHQAAQAVECANANGKASEFIKTVYASQDSIGLIGWGALGRRAGILDTARFGTCARSPELHARIQRGLDIGAALGVTTTPTVMVNGLRFAVPPSKSRLVTFVDSLLRAHSERGSK